MGVISPVGNDLETFWRNISAGVCGIDFISKFDTTDFKVKIAGEVKGFDPLDYVEKNDVRRSDLFTLYGMAAAIQAVEDSGIAGKAAPERLGVYLGSGVGGINTLCTENANLLTKGPKRVTPFFVPMMIINILSGAVAIKYGARGPCLPVVTACSTSTHALGEAFRCIKHGYADALIAGGAEAAVNQLSVAGFSNCMALTQRNEPQNASIPFDRRRDGFVIAEGAGVMVLEEYEHAVKRDAKIYGEIKGYGNTCDAYHITAPHPESAGTAAAITLALNEAQAREYRQVYINAHGTSTPLNDKSETAAIKKALGERAYQAMISSSKSMTGHMLGATGVVEAMASVLALGEGLAPPTIGYREPDPECDLNYVPNLACRADFDLALSVNLGFGGHNACLAFTKV